jgi:hypothetical protein
MLKGKAFLFVSCLSPFAKARPPCFPGTHGELNEIAMCVCFPQFQLPLALEWSRCLPSLPACSSGVVARWGTPVLDDGFSSGRYRPAVKTAPIVDC